MPQTHTLRVWDLFGECQRFTTNYGLYPTGTSPQHSRCPVASPLRGGVLLSADMHLGCGIAGPTSPRILVSAVIEPENYIFQAIFTPRLMANVRAAARVVCGQQ